MLVASSGIGTIAAGVAKAMADTILISGHGGGTGASPQSSIKYVGIPWEMGLSEVHQVLTLNRLRHRVVLLPRLLQVALQPVARAHAPAPRCYRR